MWKRCGEGGRCGRGVERVVGVEEGVKEKKTS